MARPEWLRTFVAVYRAGSITEAARLRALSQPAASQQLAGLERAVGAPLFARGPAGVVPTARGRELYAEVAAALDQLEAVLSGLDAGRVTDWDVPIRFGSSAEYFSASVVPRLGQLDIPVVGRFGPDVELLELLGRGELDIAVTSSVPARRSIAAVSAGAKQFILVGPPAGVHRRPASFRSLAALGSWLAERPWIAFSQELPITRRFWHQHLGRPFPSANLRLVAPDLRAVAAGVADGIGYSLLPSFVCAALVAAGTIQEVHPVSDLVPLEPWFLCVREGELARPVLARLVAALQSPFEVTSV